MKLLWKFATQFSYENQSPRVLVVNNFLNFVESELKATEARKNKDV